MAMTQKTRSLVTLLVLAAVSAGAGLFAWYGVYEKQEKEKADKERKEKIFPELDKAQVAQVTVSCSKGEVVTLVRSKQPEGWNLVAPVNAAAEKATVDSLIDRLTTLKSKSLVEEKAQDLTKYGLEQPKLKVVAKTEDGKEWTLRAGDENAFDSSVYVATGDSRDVLQTEGNFKHALDKCSFEVREKRVLPVEESEISDVAAVIDGTRWAATKRDGKWYILLDGSQDRADDQALNKIVGALRGLRATRFVTDSAGPEQVAKYLSSPRLEATLTLAGGQKLILVAGEAVEDSQKKSFARRTDATFIAEIPNTIFQEVHVMPADLRDKTIVLFEKDKVAKAVFAFGDGSEMTLERQKPVGDAGRSEDWTVTSPTPGAAKKWKMNSLLWALSSLKAVKQVESGAQDLAKYGLDKPTRRIALVDEAGKDLGGFAFGKEEGDKVYARNTAETRIYQIEKSRMGELPASPADLAEPPPATDAGSIP
ncbi:MAG: DUF4340 domain-containing protein [Deltaproteobacteria bacterium]|nr:DUF4340 domain-containing protein [Deltaproteobacteria bacterium]